MSEPFPLEPLDAMNAKMREGFARINAARNQDAPRDEAVYADELERLRAENSALRATIADLRKPMSGTTE